LTPELNLAEMAEVRVAGVDGGPVARAARGRLANRGGAS
jgi:hypothetical protein